MDKQLKKSLTVIMLLLCSNFGIAQDLIVGDSLVIPKIKKLTSEIYDNADKTHFYLTKQQLRRQATSSTSITAKTFQEKINRIIASSTISTGILSTEWYFDNEGKIIYIYETLEYFNENETLESTYRNFKNISAVEARYYFENEILKCQKYKGSNIKSPDKIQVVVDDGKAIFNYVTNQITQSNCACCAAPYTDFDFWKGDWYVTDTLGNKVGDNTLTKIESNCILKEHWRGIKGGTGTSINFYNKVDSTWNQTWVDSRGNVLRLKGNFVNQKMILRSELIQGKKKKYYNQVIWTPNKDGTVTQLWELYDENENLLQTLFKGIYHRKENE